MSYIDNNNNILSNLLAHFWNLNVDFANFPSSSFIFIISVLSWISECDWNFGIFKFNVLTFHLF